jgi:pheromone shutdown-related protein TraB
MELNNNPETLHRLYREGREILLIGTAHVSRESTRIVKEVIEAEKPDTVCVELCEPRFQTIRQPDQWRNTDIIKVIKEKKSFLLLSNLLLASFQKRIAEKLDVKPGEEMIAAMDAADAIGARIHLADREIRVTLARTWRIMGLWDKSKLLFQLISSLVEIEDISEADVEKMKEQDVLESLLSEVGKSMPVLKTILIDERDQYLAEKIRTAPGEKIIAVVGAGHVPGIKKYWGTDINLADLETLPPKGKISGILQWLIPLSVVALIGYGFYNGGMAAGKEMLLWWSLTTGLLAGAGALVAFGHPLTILSSILAAPITTLHPLIAAGWVSGLVEAISRTPKVKDLESLPADILSIRGFWRNKVTRILLVVVFTNIGASIGAFVAMPFLVKLL